MKTHKGSENKLQKNSDAWPLVQFYADCHNVDANHIRSYDEFIVRMKDMIKKTIVVGNVTLKIDNLEMVAPYKIENGKKVDVYPSECTESKESYCSEMYCSIECITDTNVQTSISDKKILKHITQKFSTAPQDFYKTIEDANPKGILQALKKHMTADVCGEIDCPCTTDKWHHNLSEIKSEILQMQTESTSERVVFERVHIGTVPVMVGSCLCNLRNGNPPKEVLDKEFIFGLGGYFVHKGTCRYIMFQERSTFNRLMNFDNTKKMKNKKFSRSVEIRNSATNEASTSLIALGIQKDGNVYVNLQFVQENAYIPAFHFFYAMQITDPERILSYIISKDDPLYERAAPYLLAMFELASKTNYMDEIGSLGKDKVLDKEMHIEMIINKFFLHHYNSIEKKAKYFGFMIYTLIQFNEGILSAEDRDHFGKKVLDSEANLFSNVFYVAMKKTVAEITSNLEKSIKNVNAKVLWPIKDSQKMPITSGFCKALTTNNWGGLDTKDSVSQILKPVNYANAIICFQRCCLQLKSTNKNKVPRMVHPSMYGVIDLYDTPEGEKVGYQKILAALSYLSNTIDTTLLVEYILKKTIAIDKPFPPKDFSNLKDSKSPKKVFVDYQWVGVDTRENLVALYHKLRKFKTTLRIDPTVSIVWNDVREELHVHTQAGRLMRAWLVVKDGVLVYNTLKNTDFKDFTECLASGCMEMLDQNEFEFTNIASSIDFLHSCKNPSAYQYCDIHPATLLGLGAGCITDPSRNQGPRNAFGANMKRQAIGSVGKPDGARGMFYPQRSVVENKLANVMLKYDQCPAGMNVPIAFCPYKGMTIEDGSIVSKSAIEMGLFWTDYTTSYLVEINDPEREFLEIPSALECMRYKSHKNHNLGEDGIIKKGSIVMENDVLCGKTVLVANETKPKRDDSLLYRETNKAYVKDVKIIHKNLKNLKIVKIDLVEIKIPEWGNKITPLCAQKTTISEIAAEEDLPFCPYPNEYPNPVVFYNALCLPSRMTISLLCEVFLGKYVSACDYQRVRRGKKGKYSHNGFEDCTQFNGTDEEKLFWVMDRLAEMGYRRDGCLEMYNGMTGKPITTHIYTGIVHMQVLKHMVSDKINVRSTGPVQSVMRCPPEGRSKKGGVKIGTMEKDCLIANGVSNIILDRMCLSSSKYVTTICVLCGIIETFNPQKSDRECRVCKKPGVMVNIVMPYSFKVIIQEMMSLGIIIRLLTKPSSQKLLVAP